MKKLHSLIILLILAAAVFVGCSPSTGDNSDGGSTGNGGGTTTTEQNTPDPTYGFVKTVNYTVVANGQSLPGTKTGAELIAIAKEKNLVKDTDYTINGTTVSLTASGVTKFLGNTGGDTPITYTLVGEKDNAAKYVLANLPTTDNPSEYAEGDTVTFSIKTKTGETPTATATELYLVKVTIKKRYTGDVLDIPVTYNKENHTVSFTMPDNDVMVRADFEDVSFKAVYDSTSNDTLVVYSNKLEFDVGICFTEKVFDNLEYIDGVYVFRVAKKDGLFYDVDGSYNCKITSTAKNYKSCAIVGEKVIPPHDGQINIYSAN